MIFCISNSAINVVNGFPNKFIFTKEFNMTYNFHEDINKLEKKIRKLADNHKKLKSEIEKLKQENKELKITIKEKNENIDNFQYQVKISKIAKKLAVENERSNELKDKIDEYIKEINNCIAFLNS